MHFLLLCHCHIINGVDSVFGTRRTVACVAELRDVNQANADKFNEFMYLARHVSTTPILFTSFYPISQSGT